jgi:sugar (pentulose or hexulose) kinase
MTTEHLVGIDLGTSSVKVAVTDLAGAELSHGSAPLSWTTVPTGAETTLADFRRLALTAVDEALRQAPAGPVLAIGITGMAEAGSVFDAHGVAMTPVIAWHDTRGREEADRLTDGVGAQTFVDVTGLPVSTTPTILKLAWLTHNTRPLAAADYWLGVPEGLAHALGAAPVADLSLSCRTGLLDLDRLRWWPDAVEWLGAPAGLLPEIVPSGTNLGTVPASLDVPGALHGATITVAGHDHLTASFGAGATGQGDLFDSCGTAEALVRPTAPIEAAIRSQAVADGLSVSWHVLPGLQALIAATRTGLVLSSVLHSVAPGEQASTDNDAAGPAWHQAVQSATNEFVTLARLMEKYSGTPQRTVAAGGWTQSRSLMAAKHRARGPIVLPRVQEAAARGAALMGAVAAGCFGSAFDAPPPAAQPWVDGDLHDDPTAQPGHKFLNQVPGTKERVPHERHP